MPLKNNSLWPPNSKNTFHIALTGSTDYIPHLGIVASSIYEYNKDLSICYHFFVNYLTKEDEARLLQTAKSMNSPLEVHLINDNCFKTLLLPDGIAAFSTASSSPPPSHLSLTVSCTWMEIYSAVAPCNI